MVERKNIDIYLFTTFYIDKNVDRQKEYMYTIKQNLLNTDISRIIFLLEPGVEAPFTHDKITSFSVPKRPTYNEFLRAIEKFGTPTGYNLIAATDIYFNKTIKQLELINFENTALCLNRWDIIDENRCQFFNRYYTSDTWVFKGIPKVIDADYYLGQAGCDNRFIYDLSQNGYRIFNPSLSIITWHLHITQIRTWTKGAVIFNPVPKPYLYSLPDFINGNKTELNYKYKKHLYRQIRYDLNKAILLNNFGENVTIENMPNKVQALFNCIRYFNYSRKNKDSKIFNLSEVV